MAPDTKTVEDFIVSRGMKFPRHPEIIQGKIRRMLRRGVYERKESEAALRVVRKDDVVVELGGGIGYMSTLVATKRAVKSVHVFEANANLIPYMKSVHQANGVRNVQVTNAILGPRKGKVDFYIREPMLGSSMQVLEGEIDPPSVKVDVLNAKTTLKEIGANVLICDIEGAEVDLIPDIDLTGLRAAIIETHPQWIGPEGVNKVFRALMDAGLAYYHRGSEGKVIAFRDRW
ncbi:FkbM family methyltransferase [Sulfitobacter sp. F26204]|uniref:FkbM family methyltransferase n=1 Tax=Sulfitobacter sp. F26204 TaxID=2996014 RepID=UPI00225E6919|nr:FkbM family methyltransferase [Sulfitobacter sp. F26204]MCX7559479.1 FkbM family methyltransferase [Sulfitobacter sp. F26204]